MRRGLAGAAVVLALATTASATETARVGKPAMGTVFQATVIADDRGEARRLAEAAWNEAKRWDDVLTTWRPEGELSRLNARAGAGRVPVSVDLAAALRSMLDLHRETAGVFDPAVGGIVTTLRSGGDEPDRPRSSLGDVLAVGDDWARITAGVELDAGGIGKGIALDAIADLLRREGATAAYLDFGGSSQLAFGAPPAGGPGWTLALAGLEEGEALGILHLSNAAIATSRAHPSRSEEGAIVDPRTGRAVPPPRLATVLAPSATAADAWSTAAVVLDRDEAIEKLEAAGLEGLVADRRGVRTTAGFPNTTAGFPKR